MNFYISFSLNNFSILFMLVKYKSTSCLLKHMYTNQGISLNINIYVYTSIKIVHIAVLSNASASNSYRHPFLLIRTLQITRTQAIFFMKSKSFTVTDEQSVVQQLHHTAQ